MTKKSVTSLVLLVSAMLSVLLFSVQSFAVNPNDLLHPDAAFKGSITSLSNDKIKASWKIADGYYMYRKRFSFKSDTAGIALGEPIIPKGLIKDDPGFGTVETYRKQVDIEIPIIRDDSYIVDPDSDNSASNDIQLSIKTVSQGCADVGVCYPPQKKTLTTPLNTLDIQTTNTKPKAQAKSLADKLGLSSLFGSQQPLPPEEAFRLKLKTTDNQTIKANWTITKGHYLYQDKIKLTLVEPTTGLTIGALVLPEGKVENDPFFGEITTYNKDFSVSAKISADDNSSALLTQAITIKASYQGCSKLTGICYPPQHETLTLRFNAAQINTEVTLETDSIAVDDNPLGMIEKPSFMQEGANSDQALASASIAIEKSDLASQLGIQDLGIVDDTLDPDKAFVLDVTLDRNQQLNARWDIVEGHYLYQHKFNFELLNSPEGISLGKAILPEGKAENDQYFGDIVTYNESFDAKVPLLITDVSQADSLASIALKTTYQGCSKLTGICYPPQSKTQEISLKGFVLNTSANGGIALNDVNKKISNENKINESNENFSSQSAESLNSQNSTKKSSGDDKVSEQDSLINKLTNGGFFNSLVLFFLAGLALTFTPCVFPMIPILSGIIAGQGSDNNTRKSFFLSLSYVLAMAVTYAVVGVIAALSGENLQVALQNPWVIGAFAILFILLSLSMFGFYELQMPASIQSKLTNISNSQSGGSMMNAGVMGFLSALIVGPCVTAPLIAALVYIAQTKDVLLGGLSLFALGLGMGVPLLIIGTSAGKILPKAGAWMENVKAGFGIMMLALAIWMLERILPFSAIVILTGILAVFTGIYMGALDALNEASTGWKRFFKASGLVVLLYGAILLIGAASGNASLIKPLKGFGGSTTLNNTASQHLVFKKIKGINGLEEALALANQQNKTVMLDFYADWCISCKEMEYTTFTDQAVIEALKDTLLIQADVTLDDEQDKALNKRFGLFGPPAILFFDESGKEKLPYRIVGYKGPKPFYEHIEQFKQHLN